MNCRVALGLGLVLGLVLLAGGCATDADENPAAERSTLEIHWQPAVGFGMAVEARRELDKLGRQLWVVGEGVSAPLWTLPDNLPEGAAYPDILLPEQIEPGTKLALYTLAAEGTLDHLVADLVVAAPPTELAYGAYYEIYKSTCGNYCDYAPCNSQTTCRYCDMCYYNGWSYCGSATPINRFPSDSLVCEPFCGSCTGGAYHQCWTVHSWQFCYNAGGCFATGTQVTMADGSTRNIEDVRRGDAVLAYDQERKMPVASKVTETFVHRDIKASILLNGTIRVTPNHPFFANGEWTEAGRLELGDILVEVRPDGSVGPALITTRVTSLESVETPGPVYNIRVADQHTYFADGVLVHNK
jgi:hypothetical protein